MKPSAGAKMWSSMKYLERRVIHAVLLLVAASILSFLFSSLAPGSFFDEMKLNPQISDSINHCQ
jgi:ABC-type dipeptide/oligopeptide/nickel transport system permease component